MSFNTHQGWKYWLDMAAFAAVSDVVWLILRNHPWHNLLENICLIAIKSYVNCGFTSVGKE